MCRFSAPRDISEAEERREVEHFRRLAGRPAGSDLIFWPPDGVDTDEDMVAEVERYRTEAGLPGFRED